MELSNEQKVCVSYKDEGHLLVTGVPGSGKSTVLVERAGKLKNNHPDESVLLIAYNKSLASYLPAMAEQNGAPVPKVMTFHSWSNSLLRSVGIHADVIGYSDKTAMVHKALDAVRTQYPQHRVLRFGVEFWKDEISFIKGKRLDVLEKYLECSRSGRGTEYRVTREDRQMVFRVFEEYRRLLSRTRRIEFDDFANLVIDNIAKIPEEKRVDHLLVDEAQDLKASDVFAISLLARKSITIGADKGQKIYKTGYTWKDVGINILGGRTKKLPNSFRSTDQIISLATSLQKHDLLMKSNDEEYSLPQLSGRQGPLPVLLPFATGEQEYQKVAELASALIANHPKLSVGILAKTHAQLDIFQARFTRMRQPVMKFTDATDGFFHSGIKLITYHSAKGLEFDIVIATGLYEGNLPVKEPENLVGEDLDEFLSPQRHLLYVGMTRAKQHLYLTYHGVSSRFLGEMNSDLYETRDAL